MITDFVWEQLSAAAWKARETARIYGKTKVGAAALAEDGRIFPGCNVEHRFRSHDIHAETNALGNAVSAGAASCTAILIAADREQFTPCGACLDWIFELGGPACIVGFQREPGGELLLNRAEDLMPRYPR